MAKGTRSGLGPIVALALVAAAGTARAQVVASAAADDARASVHVSTLGPLVEPVRSRPDEPKGSEGGRATSVMAYDEHFSFAVEDGCNYTASIRGTVRPVALGPEAYRKVEPDLAVTAVLACPSAEAVKVAEKVAGTGPITRTDLESLIARAC
jgi:hypothetical protein